MRIRRFTPESTHIVNLIQTDTGRPLQHVSANLAYDGMIDDIAQVLNKLTPKEAEVETHKGEWYKMRIIPYRTTDNRIDGAVLTFSSIEEQKSAQAELKKSIRELEQAWEVVREAFDTNQEPMAVIDGDGKLVMANTAFSELSQIPQEDIFGADILNRRIRGVDAADLKTRLKPALDQGWDFKTGPFEMAVSGVDKTFNIKGRVIRKGEESPCHILLHFSAAQ